MRRAGNARPDAISPERTRSRASETALSARPTTWKAGRPGETWTCTSTARASIPSKATVETRATMPDPYRAPIDGNGTRRKKGIIYLTPHGTKPRGGESPVDLREAGAPALNSAEVSP